MSQRIKYEEEEIFVNVQVKVKLKSFSNHDGSTDAQIDQAKEEFKDEIEKHLMDKLADEYTMEEFLYSVDFVDYEVEPNIL